MATRMMTSRPSAASGARSPIRTPPPPSGPSLNRTDIQACYKLWRSRGAEFITEPIPKYGEIRCYIRDPDGYIIEVGQSTDLTRNADIHKAVDVIRVGNAEGYRRLVGSRTAPDVDKEPRIRDLNVRRRAAAVASAQNATPEDRFVKSSRSFDVGDGEKVCDGKPILRRHLIGFLLDLYLVLRRLQLGFMFFRLLRRGSFLDYR
jgi:hypothetical protein